MSAHFLAGLLLVAIGGAIAAAAIGGLVWLWSIVPMIVLIALLAIALERSGHARTIAWTIVWFADREARGEGPGHARHLLLVIVAIGAVELVSHVVLSGNWMAQAGFSLPVGGLR